jgi:glutamine amidotransferase
VALMDGDRGRTVIVDYGMGNIASIRNMIARLGGHADLTGDPNEIDAAQRIILPGVGAFDTAMTTLRHRGLAEALQAAVERDACLLGICLGMQVLFDGSDEGSEQGLGLLPGRVRRFPWEADGRLLRVPHMGWSEVQVRNPTSVLPTLGDDGRRFYFVHSYYADPQDPADVVATSRYGIDFASVVGAGRVVGVQFHPEKSHRHGMSLLADFLRAPGGRD